MKRKLISILVVCTMLASLCVSSPLAAAAADITIDGYSTSLIAETFTDVPSLWGSNSTYDADAGVLALHAGSNTNRNWNDGKNYQGLVSWEFDYMIPSASALSGNAYFGLRDSEWKDGAVNFFLITNSGYVRKGFNDDWTNLYTLTKDSWYSFKVILDTATGEYWVYVTTQGSDFPVVPLIKSQGRYASSNPAASGVRGITFQSFTTSVTDSTVIAAYIDNVKTNKISYAYEAINAAASDEEIMSILDVYAESRSLFVIADYIKIINSDALCSALKAQTLTSDAEIVEIITEIYNTKSYKLYLNHDFETANPIPGKTVVDGTAASDAANTGKYLDLISTTQTAFRVSDYNIIPDEAVVEFRAKPVSTSTWFPMTLATGGKGVAVSWNIDASTTNLCADWVYYRLILDADEAAALEEASVSLYYSKDGISWTEVNQSVLGSKFSFTAASSPVFDSPVSQITFSRSYVDDIKIYQYGTAPLALDAKLTYNGEAYEASYIFSDSENDTEGAATYVWQVSSDNETFTDISGAASKTWTPDASYMGKYIRCIITPRSSKYPTDGTAVVTDSEKYAVYTEFYANDYEDYDPETDTTIVAGDGVNTTKFKTTSKYIDIMPGTTVADELAIDFRIKPIDGNNNSLVQAIFKNWGGLVAQVTFDGNLADYTNEWTYYRLYIDSDQATSLDGVTFKLYRSADGLSWTEATTRQLTKTDNASTSTDVTRFYNLTQVRFSGYVDDIKMYKYGTAPVGTNAALTAENGTLNTSFAYSDAEGDIQGTAGYTWEVSDDNNVFTPVEGVTSASWNPDGAYNDKYIRCVITPKSSRYPTDGEAIVTDSVKYKATYIEHFSLDYEDADPTTDTTIIDGSAAGDAANPTQYKYGGKNFTVNLDGYLPDELAVEFRAKSIPYEENGKQLQYHAVYLIGNYWGGAVTMVIFDSATIGYSTDWAYYRVVVDSIDATSNDEMTVKMFTSPDGTHWTEADYNNSGKKISITAPGTNGSGTYADAINMLRFDWAMVDDIKIYQYGTAPTAESASINVTDEGVFAGVNGYADTEGDAASTPLYQWQYSEDNVTFYDIAGQSGEMYADDGKYDEIYLRCVVTPVSSKWPCYGDALTTDSVYFETSKEIYASYTHYDVNDTEITSYTAAEGFKTVFTINNNTDSAQPVTVISAVYNKETGKLIKVNKETATVEANANAMSLTLNNAALAGDEIPVEGTYTKIMVINSLEGLKPYRTSSWILQAQ